MANQESSRFPDNFLWGAATSSYQVEGNNSNSDWWEWEKAVGLKDVSGQATNHYQLYKQDFDLAKSLSHNAHRLSLEWARLEPQQNSFSQNEIDHYIQVISYLKNLQIEPVVTLHHFTNPIWLARLGGWENRATIKYFLNYVSVVVEALCDKVKYWVTINEPNVYVHHSYLIGEWPPQKKSLLKTKKAAENLLSAHIQAYKLIHSIYKKRNLPPPSISIAQNTQLFIPCVDTARNRFSASMRNKIYNLWMIERLLRKRTLDFIGINYYSRTLVETKSWWVRNILSDECDGRHNTAKKNSMGWDIYPEGLYLMLMQLKRYRLPVFILENGICTSDDNLRWDYIREHLFSVIRAMGEGVPVLGYTYWSLLDNYEWDKGFAPRFGLIDVDYTTFKRTVRESAKKLAQVCKTGRLE